MNFGVCNLAMIPMRGEPSEKAELVSQLLFGETYEVIDEENVWLKVRTTDCSYEGWISDRQHNPLHPKDIESYIASEKYVVRDYLFFLRNFESNVLFPIFIGSSFPYPQNDMLILGDSVFILQIPPAPKEKEHLKLTKGQYQLLSFLSTYLESPYLWGGRTPAGIDCSGLVQIAYKSIGILLPRDASQQVHVGETVDFIHEAQVGDVAFFQNENGEIVHTGVISAERKIIHASGKVRVDTIDSTGIYNKKEEKYTHYLRIIKRILT